MPTHKGAVRWHRKGAHWDKAKDGLGVVMSERQLGPVQVVAEEFYGRHVIEAPICSWDGLLEYWEILGRVVDPATVSAISDTTHRNHTDAVPAESLDMATRAQLKEFLPPELGMKSIGRIFFVQ